MPIQAARRKSRRAEDDSDEEGTQSIGLSAVDIERMSKNLVRLALSLEHARLPIRRDLISKEILQGASRRAFALVFARAQEQLQAVFGMQLEELPVKDRKKGMTVTQMRKQALTQATTATQAGTQAGGSSQAPRQAAQSKAWVLKTLLSPDLRGKTMGVFVKHEAVFNAVAGVILVLVSMSAEQTCASAKMLSYLARLEWEAETPAGKLEDVLRQMRKYGYLDSYKDDSTNEAGGTLYHLGPRGKAETLNNVKGLTGLVKKLYKAEPGTQAAKKIENAIQGTLEVAMDDDMVDGSGDELAFEDV